MSTERTVHVRRTIRIEYSVPMSAYEGMTEDEVRAWESADNVGPEMILDSIISDAADVWFSDKEAV